MTEIKEEPYTGPTVVPFVEDDEFAEEDQTDPGYYVKVYIKTHGGYFRYHVDSMDQAVHHGAIIMKEQVYRRVTEYGDMEFWPVYKVKISGPDLDSEYMDEFVRT